MSEPNQFQRPLQIKNRIVMPVFDDLEAKQFIDTLFSEISECNDAEDLKYIPDRFKFGEALRKKMPSSIKYPRLSFRLNSSEIDELIKLGIIEKELTISPQIANGILASGYKLSPLERICYSLLWKNGVLGKEQHFIAGVLDKKSTDARGAVFNNFGQYIAGNSSFILDQHTLRCFAVHLSDSDEVSTARKLSSVDGRNMLHKQWISAYSNFYENLTARLSCDSSNFFYELDKLLFGAGKLIK